MAEIENSEQELKQKAKKVLKKVGKKLLIIFLLIILLFINTFSWKSRAFCINPCTVYGFSVLPVAAI